MDLIRILDFMFATICLVIISPVIIIIAFIIKITSPGPVFYKQVRVGKNGKDFRLFKFRTMKIGSDKGGLLTVGDRDSRITRIGYYLRKFKIDELPQILNVLKGEMSVVGPRPEVRKYVELYNIDQLKVLNVLPGITDYASIEFRNENDLLAKADDPEDYYIKVIMPKKIELNSNFISNRTIKEYFYIIFKTAKTAIRGN